MIVALSGGTGGAKLIEGLASELDPAELTIICNTGDDAIFHGLYVCPDLDTIVYTLAGCHDAAEGWGIENDSFAVLEQLRRLGNETWFRLGDKDLAMHITRTRLLNEGEKLSAVTDRMRRVLGARSTILPMSDERVETRVTTAQGEISFQEYFVRQRWSPEVSAVGFAGVETCQPAPGVLNAIQQAESIIICPSNPVTSIGPILAVPGIRAAIAASSAPVVGVSPIIDRVAFSGPAHKLMAATGFEASAFGVAKFYADLLDTLLVDKKDRTLSGPIADLNIACIPTEICMSCHADKRRLARELLAWAQK
jgi:LPPG:FO 2-phospho-L-lactate transferase